MERLLTTGDERPRIPIATKTMPEIRDIFGLRLIEEEGFGLDPLLKLEYGQGEKIPELVAQVLNGYALVTTKPPPTHLRTEAILFLTMAEHKRRALGDTQASTESSPLALNCQFKMHVTFPGMDRGRKVLWTGQFDYLYWYGSPENAETNLIVVKAKRRYSSADMHPQTFGYMAIIHDARKRAGEVDASVYGISTNDFEWKFYCIDHDLRASCITLTWYYQKEQIILLLNRIIDKASSLNMLSSTLRRTSTVSESTGISIQSADDMDIEEDSGNEDK